MTISFNELAILAMVLCCICWMPAPAFIWHQSGRWFVFSTSLLVMLFCLFAYAAQWLWRRRPFTHPCRSAFIRG